MGSLRPLSSGIPIWVATIVGVLAVLWLPLLRPLLTFFLFNKQIPLVGLQPFDPSIPQNSYFPEGCVWRDVEPNGSTAFWQKREYEYLIQARNPSCHRNVTEKCWDERWTREQPLACRLRTTRMNGFLHRLSNLETTVDCTESHCVIDNLWYNNGMFYGVFEQMDDPYETMALTQDIDLNALHVRSSQDFVRQLNATRVRGSTLLIDFVYFIHPVRWRATWSQLDTLQGTFSSLFIVWIHGSTHSPNPPRVL